MKKIQTLLVIFFLLITSNLQAQPTDCVSDRYLQEVFPNLQITRDITYATNAPNVVGFDQDLELDFFEPAPADEYLPKRPLVVMLFGGAFLGGSKNADDMQTMCERLARHGYVCASPEYRLDNIFSMGTSQDRVERAMFRCAQDAHAAVRYLVEDPNNVGYNIDPNRIYVGGSSAGAIGALHMAYMNNSERLPSMTSIGTLESVGNSYNPAFTVAGVLDYWGAILNDAMIDATDNIPMLIVHGDNDTTVPYGTAPPYGGFFPTAPLMYGAVPMDARLALMGIAHDFHTYAGEGHTVWGGSTSFPNQYWDPIFFQTRDFLYDKTLQFDSPMPTGALTACTGDTETYSVPANADSYFCWDVTGGTVISTNNEQVTIQWNTVGMGQLTLTEANCLDVIGTAQTINVDVSACSCANFDLVILFDGFPNQSSWEIVDVSDNSIIASGGTYAGMSGYSTLTESTCLPDGCYTLNFYDTLGNGTCPFNSIATSAGTFITPGTVITPGSVVATLGTVVSPGLCGNYTLSDAMGSEVVSGGGSFGSIESNTFCLTGGVVPLQQDEDNIYQRTTNGIFTNINIYPNPAYDQITIEHNIQTDNHIQIAIMDVNGKMVQQHSNVSANDAAISLNVSDLVSGVYFIQMIIDDRMITEKFIVR